MKILTLAKLGKKEESIELVQSLISSNPKSALNQEALGEIFMIFGEYEKALN